MSFPAGRLPNAGEIQDMSKIAVPFKSVVFTSGGSDFDCTDPNNGITPCSTEFLPTSTGNLIAQMVGDAAPKTMAVTAGTPVKGLFVLIKSTSTANGLVRQ